MGFFRVECEYCAGTGEVPYDALIDDDGEHRTYTTEYHACPLCKGDGVQLEPDALEVVFDCLPEEPYLESFEEVLQRLRK